MNIKEVITVNVRSKSSALKCIETLERKTWPSVIYRYGQFKGESLELSVAVNGDEWSHKVFQRDYAAQGRTKDQVWRLIQDDATEGCTIEVGVKNGITIDNTNNLQIVFFARSSFFVIAVTAQLTPGGVLCVVMEKTWHGKVFKDQTGKVRVPDLERKNSGSLLETIRAEYVDDELPIQPLGYCLWADKIEYDGLRDDEVVVIAMDTAFAGGRYYARDNESQFIPISSDNIIGCPFPTVGTILIQSGDRWKTIDEEGSLAIFTGRLGFSVSNDAHKRLVDVRESKLKAPKPKRPAIIPEYPGEWKPGSPMPTGLSVLSEVLESHSS